MKHIKCFVKFICTIPLVLFLLVLSVLQFIPIVVIALLIASGCINYDVLEADWSNPVLFNGNFWKWYKNL